MTNLTALYNRIQELEDKSREGKLAAKINGSTRYYDAKRLLKILFGLKFKQIKAEEEGLPPLGLSILSPKDLTLIEEILPAYDQHSVFYQLYLIYHDLAAERYITYPKSSHHDLGQERRLKESSRLQDGRQLRKHYLAISFAML